MTIRRWIADEFDADTAALVADNAHHLAVVLRARVGQEFAIACGQQLRRGIVTGISPSRVVFELREELAARPGSSITLFLSIFKFDRLEWAIEKSTELGVSRITPLIARRTDTHLSSAAAKRVERWRRIAKEAAQQSRRLLPPEIDEPVKVKPALEGCDAAVRIVLSEAGQDAPLARTLSAEAAGASIALAIGPEGGWTPEELKLFIGHGWKPASLGATVLRAETAAIAAIAVVSSFAE
jgi:16S rRNA (uracil1498-N3)-methyltransferase